MRITHLVTSILAFGFLSFGDSATQSHAAGAGDIVPGMVIVRFTEATNPVLASLQLLPAQFGISEIDAILATIPSAELRPFLPDRHSTPSVARQTLERTYILRFDEATDPESIAALLTPFSEFEQVRVERYARAHYFGTKRHVPPDSEFSPAAPYGGQWNLDSSIDEQDIDAPEAWEIERGDPAVIIGIADSGTMVDTTGVEFWELSSDIKYLFNLPEDVEPQNKLNYDDIDENDSGSDPDTWNDNIIGSNFSPGAPEGSPFELAFWSATPIDALIGEHEWEIMRYFPHGLQVESVAASKEGGFGPSVCGVAPMCKVYHVRISLVLDTTVEFDPENPAFVGIPILDAQVITHAAIYAHVINMSWGYDSLTEDQRFDFVQAVKTATDPTTSGGYDRVLVAAVGNISEITPDEVVIPARLPEVLGVGNMTKALGLFFDSAYGPEMGFVSVVAPVDHGVPVETHTQCSDGGGGTGNYPCPIDEDITLFNGTSAAAPQAAGLAALIRTRFPGLNQQQVRDRITSSAEWYWGTQPWDTLDVKKFGSGRINAYRALTEWGSITTNTTWTTADTRDGKYYVSGDLTIEAGATLTINAGVVVRIAPDHDRTLPDLDRVQIIVKGTLIVNGIGVNPVTFESFVDPVQGTTDWLGIKFEAGSVGNLSNVVIKNATRAIENHAAVTLTNCTITNCESAIEAHANVSASGLNVPNSGASVTAVKTLAGIGSFTGCAFSGNARAIENYAPITLTNCSFTNCGSALKAHASVTATGMGVIGGTGSPAVAVHAGTAEFTSCIFYNSPRAIENYVPVTLTSCTLTNCGTAIEARANVTANGTLIANNSVAVDIYAGTTSLTKCTVASNTSSATITRTGTNLVISKCVIAFHNAGPAVRALTGGTTNATMASSVVFQNASAPPSLSDSEWQTQGQVVHNIDPAFCNAGNGDYRLFAFSPASAPTLPYPGYFGERVGARDVGCVPPAGVTVSSSDPVPNGSSVVAACPLGDYESLTVTVDLNGTITRPTIDYREVVLDAADCVANVRVWDQSGFVEAQANAPGPDYITTITHSHFGGYGVNDVDILLNGHALASQAHFDLRTMDMVPSGSVNAGDFAMFGSHYTSPPKPYASQADFNGDGAVNLGDFTIFSQHYNHQVPIGYPQLNPSNQVAESNAGVALQVTEEFPTANTHRLYVDVSVENFSGVTTSVFSMRAGSNRLTFVEWIGAGKDLGEVLFTPVVRDGAQELFYGLLVSDAFEGSNATVGRLVFDVAGADAFELTKDHFVLTVADVLLESPAGDGPIAARMEGVFTRTFDPAVARIYRNRLEQNFPNPFNPTTTLAFSIKDANNVNLTIYDVAGRRIRELVNERRERGAYKVVWDGRNDNGSTVSSGVYFYKLVAGSFTDTKKMTILK